MSEKWPYSCEACGEPFTPYRPWQRFCSSTCRKQAWERRHPRVEPADQVKPLRISLVIDPASGRTRILDVEVVE